MLSQRSMVAPMMIEYKRFDEQAWADFGKTLLDEKDKSRQKDFLSACQSGKADFLQWIDEDLGDKIIGNSDLVDFKHTFTEREFLHPPDDTQKIIWDALRGKSDEMMYSCGFWGYTVRRMIEDDYIEPDYLASQLNGERKTGAFVIDQAIQSNNMDDCVRRILRSMCNPGPRGKRIVFHDFHLGKSYWRWHWAKRMSGHSGLGFGQILKILDEKYYASFSMKMHTKKSYIGSENTFGGLLLFLKQEQQNEEKITGKQLEKVIDNIAYLSAWKALEMQEPEDNKKEIQQAWAPIKNASKGENADNPPTPET